jgi:hypothetical protein
VADPYPAYGQRLSSQRIPIDDFEIDTAIDGTTYGRFFWNARKNRFVIRHALTVAQSEDLLTFYDNHRGIPVDFTYELDGALYANMLINGPPIFAPVVRSGLVEAEVHLEPT